VAVEGSSRDLRQGETTGDGVDQLAAYRFGAHEGREAGFRVAVAANGLLETVAIEAAGQARKRGIALDSLRDFGVGQIEAELVRPLVERGGCDELGENLLVDPRQPRLVRCQRARHLATELLHALGVNPAELLGGDLRR